MRAFDVSFEHPSWNLAFEEILLEGAEAGDHGECLRFWESPTYFVVLGTAQVLQAEVNEAACEAGGVPILRRCSAGGCVLQGPGCLNYTLILDQEQDPEIATIRGSYCAILKRVADALRPLGPDLRVAGTSDLALQDLKVSGNAQRRKRRYILHHGTFLCDFDVSLMARYLREPAERPEYRGERAHGEFAVNLGLTPETITRALLDAYSVANTETEIPCALRERIAAMAAEKYECDEWTRRR